MLRKALQYLPEDRQDIEMQVEDYRNSLLLYLYEKQLLLEKGDTLVPEEKMKHYYEQYKQSFELPEEVAQLNFVKSAADAPGADSLLHWFEDPNEKNRLRLQQFCRQFAINFSLSDSNWVSVNSVQNFIPVSRDNFAGEIRSGFAATEKDEAFIYAIKVNDVKNKGEIAPYEFVKDDIRKILLNKEKVGLIKKTYETIYQEALRDNSFEIYLK
jgi:hypothetical protein